MEMTYKKSGITVVFNYDKDSKYFLTESGDVISDLDEYRLYREWELLRNAKKHGLFTLSFKSVTSQYVSLLTESDNSWLKSECKRLGVTDNQKNTHLINLLLK